MPGAIEGPGPPGGPANHGYIRWLRERVGHEPILYPVGVACVRDAAGRFLLQHRADFPDRWSLPGGGIDLGERADEAAVREAREETGVAVAAVRLLGVYTGPRYAVRYPNGDRTQPIVLCYLCRPIGGVPRADGTESLACDWFAATNLPPLTVESADIIADALRERPEAFWR